MGKRLQKGLATQRAGMSGKARKLGRKEAALPQAALALHFPPVPL